MKSEILRFGFEVEGEFSEDVLNELDELPGVVIGEDGSVEQCGSDECRILDDADPGDKFHNNCLLREIKVGPGEIGEIKYLLNGGVDGDGDKREGFFNILGKYGKGYHANSSSGFHIHLSFKPKSPPELLSEDFFYSFLNTVKEKYPAEFKLRVGSRYCRFDGIEKSHDIDKKILFNEIMRDRYKAINLSSLDKHGTIEFRLWPANSPEKMYEYFMFTVNFVEKYLYTPKTFKFSLDKNFNPKIINI